LEIGVSGRWIAKKLKRDHRTINRELLKSKKIYNPDAAQKMAERNQKKAKRRESKITPKLLKIITDKLRKKWSPEQISGWLKRYPELPQISPETIYKIILADKKNGGDLYTNLRCQKKKRRRYGSKSHDRRGRIPNRVGIEKRPKIVDKRRRIGDWEGDLVMGKNNHQGIATFVDRKSRLCRIGKVPSKNAEVVGRKIYQIMNKEKIHTSNSR
jgi:IS30 family transposase